MDLHVHGEFQWSGDLVRCGLCHDVIGVLCGENCEGAQYSKSNPNEVGAVCVRCGGWSFVKLPHSTPCVDVHDQIR